MLDQEQTGSLEEDEMVRFYLDVIMPDPSMLHL